MKPWIRQVVEAEGQEDGRLAIHLGEMLSFVAFACKLAICGKGELRCTPGTTRLSTSGSPDGRVVCEQDGC